MAAVKTKVKAERKGIQLRVDKNKGSVMETKLFKEGTDVWSETVNLVRFGLVDEGGERFWWVGENIQWLERRGIFKTALNV